MRLAPDDRAEGGRLADHVQAFCRVLRTAGVPIGPGQVVDALIALRTVGLERRGDVCRALGAVLVKDPAHFRLFRQAFHVFFGNPGVLSRLARLLPEADDAPRRPRPAGASRRLLEALSGTAGTPPIATSEVDRSQTASDRERLARKDFEQMSLAELREAKELLRTGVAALRETPTRRLRPAAAGRLYDLRRSLRLMLRNNGQVLELARQKNRTRPPPLVLICDISGSMSRYSRIFLHFAHVLRARHHRVHCFVFATRLTNITRRLDEKDVDQALARIAGDVVDWDGGTRIGACLERFNIDWGRRVLAQNAVVILLSDGLECDPASGLEFQMQRLRLSCRTLIWVNPMLRYRGFEPRAFGIRRMLPHVDRFLPAHNVESLRALARTLGDPPGDRAGRAPGRKHAA